MLMQDASSSPLKFKMGVWMASISSFMSSPVISTDHETLGYEALAKMIENEINALLVEENGKFVGIFTQSDWESKIIKEGGSINSKRVDSVMSKTIITIDKIDSMASASRLMENHRIRHLVVTDKGKIVGILSSKDLENYYSELHSQEGYPNFDFP
jgi:CBS domain-containing protein